MATTETAARPEIRGIVRLNAAQLRLQRRITLVFTVAPLVGVGLAIWKLWGGGLSPLNFWLFAGFYVATGLGITVGYHRLFTHRAFQAVRPLRVALAMFGSMALQGSVLSWCATHRRHHAYADEYGDPHSPHLATASGLKGVVAGLWFAHVGWLFSSEQSRYGDWVPDLQEDKAIVKVNRAFPWLALASFTLPALLALAITGKFGPMLGAFIWGSLVRIFLLHHVTWSINSICHFYGKEAYRAHDESRNVWPLAPISFGESWHNNHHAFPWSAKLGLRAWQVDPGWYTIAGLRMLGLVQGVKVPTAKQIADRRLPKS
ncbi:MAG: acyl-CoA desaturase [Actinomycetota bacterium]